MSLSIPKKSNMQFSILPKQYASVDGEILYTFDQDQPQTVDFRVIEQSSNRLLGAKRSTASGSVAFNIAPIVRNQISIVPRVSRTGFLSSGSNRTVTVRVEAVESDTGEVIDTADERSFLAGDLADTNPGIRTTMPRDRIIPADCVDEITLLTNSDCTITVTAQNADTTIAESYRAEGAGCHIFLVSPGDFPECGTITIDAGSFGEIRYTVVPASDEFARLAWLSHVGSVEQYSFPVVRSTLLRSSKQRSEGLEGHLVTAVDTSREMTFVSAFEREEVLEALAEILSSRNVWIFRFGGYVPLDVLSEESVIRQSGSLCTTEIVARPKNNQQWI